MFNISAQMNLSDKLKKISLIYQDVFRRFGKDIPQVEVQFYDYVGINHTIRRRNEVIYIRIAKICEQMPDDVHKALAEILVSKLIRRRVPKAAAEIYRSYVKSAEMIDKAFDNKRNKGRKVLSSSKGDCYDLEQLFDELNEVYFDGGLPKQSLTWSAKKTFRILGHYDAPHQTIVISRSLDSGHVPNYVVQFVLFHEMLHVKHPVKIINGRRYSHTPIFRKEEKEFQFFEEAESWIERNIAGFRKASKKSFFRRLFDL